MATSLTVERYAEMRAEMEAGRLRDEVLARAGVGSEEWIEAQREWLQRLGSEIAIGRFELSNRYSRAFLERQQALAAASSVALDARRSEPAAAPARAALPAALSPLEPPRAAAWQPPQAPLPLAAPGQPVPPRMVAMGAGRRADPLGQTLPGVEPDAGPALPFQKQAAGSSRPGPQGPIAPTAEARPAPRKPTTLDVTLDPAQTPGPALPFGQAGPNGKVSGPPPPPQGRARPPSEAPPAARPRPPAALAQTMFGEAAPTGPALPFAKAGALAGGTARSPSDAPGPAGAEPKGARHALASTVALGPDELARIRARLAMPFQANGASPSSLPPETKPMAPAGRSSPPPAATPFEAGGRPRSSAPPAGAPPAAATPPDMHAIPRTAALPVVGLTPEPQLPFARAGAQPPTAPGLTLEQVAALVEDLGGAPNPAKVLAHYGLTGEQFQALEQRWTERMRQNPAEIQRLASAREAYRAAKAARR